MLTTTPPSYTPTAAEFGQLRAYLAQKGVSQETLKQVVGETISKRTRAQIADQLRAWLAQCPKSIQETNLL